MKLSEPQNTLAEHSGGNGAGIIGEAAWKQRCTASSYWVRTSLSSLQAATAGQCMARDFDRQVAEVQIRAAILNGYTDLGIPQTVTIG